MKNEFVPYDIALAMQELGYNESIDLVLTSYYYRNSELISTTTPDSFYFEKDEMIKAPLYQQAFRWFREEHTIHNVPLGTVRLADNKIIYHIHVKQPVPFFEKVYDTYEEAQDACLRELIEIVKEKRDEK